MEELVTFETAQLAKNKGFDIVCRYGFEYYVLEGVKHGPTEVPTDDVPDLGKLTSTERTIITERPGFIPEDSI